MPDHPISLFSLLGRFGRGTQVLIKHAIVWAVEAMVLTALAGLIPGIVVYDYADALAVIVLIAAIGTTVMPLLYRLATRLTPLLYPLLTFLIFAWLVLGLERVLPGWHVGSWWEAGITAMVLTATSAFLGQLLGLSDDGAWARYTLGPMRSRFRHPEFDDLDEPGFIFLEIDGLSEPVLEQAIAAGYVPTLARWLREGSHAVHGWICDLSSQTSAMQAGLLLGSNRDIPAFRWYDRDLKRVVVSNNPRDAAMIESELATGDGLLAGSGASRGNMFSGEAPDSLFTFSTLFNPAPHSSRQYMLFFTNLYNLARTLALFGADIVSELVAGCWQVIRNERPRVRRLGVYPIVRSATTSVLRELSTFTVAGDMFRGVPVVYATYVAYDEVAHHSGIARGDTLRVLRRVDRDIGRLERVARDAPRPYHLIVLSDHGQTQGATFRQRYQESLSDLVERLLDGGHQAEVVDLPEQDEGARMVGVLIADFLKVDADQHPVVDRALRRTGLRATTDAELDQVDVGDVIVLASGNLGTITFTGSPERQTLEEISAHHPTLVPALVAHPGIAFALVQTATQGPMVIGAEGFHLLEDDSVQGTDPLAPYDTYAAGVLRRWSTFRNAPDILIMSTWWPAENEVAAFEELVGSHGGLGGPQNQPFVLSPVSLPVPSEPLIGAESTHRVFMQWLRR